MKSALAVVALTLSFTLPLAARTWKQADSGKTIEAELIKVEGGKVHLQLAGGRTGVVELLSLSLEDQEYLSSMEKKSSGGASGGGQWPAFRGPNGDGISPDSGLMSSWPSDGPKKVWTYENAGMGYSGFSIVDGKLYTMGTRGDEVTVICVDAATGSEVWAQSIAKDDQKPYLAGWGHGPRSTPTVNDGRVYALDAQGNLVSLDAASGKVEWAKNLVEDFGGEAGGWGFAESPTIDGNKLVVCPGGSKSGIVALDKKTGDTIWEAEGLGAGKAEYASLVVAEINGTRQYIKLFGTQVVSVDATSGKQLWKSAWPGKTAVIPTPIVDGNEVYVSSGYGVGSKLFKVNPDNTTEDVWVNTVMKNHHGGVVKVGDHLYGFSDGGGLICQDWKTGEMVWNEKGQFTSKGSVHVADGHLYALNEEDGTLTLVEASPSGFKKKGQFKLDPQSPNRNPKGKVWTHPVVLNGKLYLRDQEYIVCYDVKG